MFGLDLGVHPATLEPFHLFLVLQEDRHGHRLKRPWARYHHPGLDVELGTIEEPIHDRVILFRQGALERCPSAALIFNTLTEWRQLPSHWAALVCPRIVSTDLND
jgi:hypothetical protein